MQTVLILGSTGMLGSAVLKEFNATNFRLIATARDISDVQVSGNVELIEYKASESSLKDKFNSIGQVDYIINCIGIIKPYINDADPEKREVAISVNAVFPYALEKWAASSGTKVIQIATDCVFSGSKGMYLESDKHDAIDVYGKSKSLGEVPSESMMHLRVSIIGPEVNKSSSLLEWVRSQPSYAMLNGYTDHFWNGITSHHFARIAKGIIDGNLFESGVVHVLPSDSVSKFELLNSMAQHLDRADLRIVPTETGDHIDRTLGTLEPQRNAELWRAAGYSSIPSVDQMVSEMIDWNSRL